MNRELLSIIFLILLQGTLAFGDEDPYLAGFFGELFPGAGYAYLGEKKSALLSAPLIVPILSPYYISANNVDQATLRFNLLALSGNIFGFTVYDSFQDGLDKNNRPEELVNIPHYSFKDLVLAPLDGGNYNTWKVWAPLTLLVGVLAVQAAGEGIAEMPASYYLAAVPLTLGQSLLIGVGEESEFRGFQYPAFSKLTGSKWVGATIAAVSFGTCHVSREICGVPYGTGTIAELTNNQNVQVGGQFANSDTTRYTLERVGYTTLFGLYTSWLVTTEADGFKKAIALHALNDFLIFMKDFAVNGADPFISFNFSL